MVYRIDTLWTTAYTLSIDSRRCYGALVDDDVPLYPFRGPADDPFTPLTVAARASITGPATRVRLPTGGLAWLFSRHEDVRELLRSDVFSADLYRPGYPLMRPLPPDSPARRSGALLRMDGHEHLRLRRMLAPEFLLRGIRRLEPLIAEVVDRSLDDLAAAGPPADLVAAFALPVPSLVICHLLGVPYADHAFFQQRSQVMLDRTVAPQVAGAAGNELRGYLADLIGSKRRDPGDDLLSRLIAERIDTGELGEDELTGMALLLLIAGHETTATMLGLSVLLLMRHPEHWAALRSRPETAPALVEELLRYLTILRAGLMRVATADVVVAGQPVAGEGVIALLSLANRDPGVFADPETFDPLRQAQAHLAFGFGLHQCLGQPLARAELRLALVSLAQRFPGLRLDADPATLPLRETSIAFGVEALPVSW